MINFESIINECEAIIHEQWTDGIALTFGTSAESYFINQGTVAGSSSSLINDETLFDLASVTKFFSLITILKLVENGFFSLNDTVGMHTSNYPHLKAIKIYELMNFTHQIETSVRISTCETYEQALNVLQKALIRSSVCSYTDMGVLILSKIIDEILSPYHSSFQIYSEKLWKEIGLTNTYWWFSLPDSVLNNIQNYDYEYKTINNELIPIRTSIGHVHDKKAYILKACGHAGIFSCTSDICRLLQMLLSGKILSVETIELLTSSTYDSYSKNNHYGLLCYKKYTDLCQSEIPELCSSKSIAMTGYTGTYILVDFENDFFVFIGANRLYKRNTTSNMNAQVTIVKTSPIVIYNTKNYVYRKDSLRDEIIRGLSVF